MPVSSWAAAGLIFLFSGCSSCQRTRSEGGAVEAAPESTAPDPAAGRPPTDPADEKAPSREARGHDSLLDDLPLPPKLDDEIVARGATTGPGVVTAVEPQATNIGAGILSAGGNAVDAAVATAFALCVTHPSAGNIGGGGFALVKRGMKIEAIDFREDSPRGLSRLSFDYLIESGGRGPLSVGVPGTVAGLHLLHSRHGRMPWSDLLAGAIRLAREGAQLGLRQWQTLSWARAGLLGDETAREVFFQGNVPRSVGSLVRQEKLALALERIAREGPDGFYRGPTAEDLVETLRARLAQTQAGKDDWSKALLSLDDLRTYRAEVRRPLSLDYHGTRVVTMPPPSAGGPTLLLNLSMLQALQVQETPRGTSARYHLVAEASRRAQVERRLLISAPSRMQEPPEERIERWSSAGTWLLEHPIDRKKATPSKSLHPLYEESLKELEHTTHLSVVDAEGTSVSLTVTLSGSFGSQILGHQTGIVLNNSVASFGSVGDNVPLPSVRTTSSMAPTLVLAGDENWFVLGSPGGDTIPSTITQLILALVDDQQSLEAAVLTPRIHQGFVPDELGMERLRPLPPEVQAELERLGHRVRPSRSAIGDANIAAWLDGKAIAVYDPREGGLAKSAEPTPQAPSAPPSPRDSP